MEGLEAKAVELLDKLEKVTTNLAPQALEVAEKCMVVSGVGGITVGFISVIVFSYISYRLGRFLRSKECYDKDFEGPTSILMFFTIIPIPFGVYSLLNAWNWVAIFYPKLAIANKLLGF